MLAASTPQRRQLCPDLRLASRARTRHGTRPPSLVRFSRFLKNEFASRHVDRGGQPADERRRCHRSCTRSRASRTAGAKASRRRCTIVTSGRHRHASDGLRTTAVPIPPIDSSLSPKLTAQPVSGLSSKLCRIGGVRRWCRRDDPRRSIALRLLVDRPQPHVELSSLRRSFTPVHGRSQALVDVAVMLADGGKRPQKSM